MANGNPTQLILPGLDAEEMKAKQLAVILLEKMQEGGGWSDRVIMGALAVLAATTIKARFKIFDREKTFSTYVRMTRHILDQ